MERLHLLHRVAGHSLTGFHWEVSLYLQGFLTNTEIFYSSYCRGGSYILAARFPQVRDDFQQHNAIS